MKKAGNTLAVVLSVLSVLSACGDSDPQPRATLQRSERTWVDTSRATPRKPGFAGADTRTLRVLLWTPPTFHASPLVVLAHGFGGAPQKFEAFATTLAAAGYVIAAPTFPLTNENAPGGHETGLGDVRSQPGDISFVVTQLLNANATPGDALYGRIESDAIAVLGHSLGAVTTIALTRKQCCSDARVRAAILVAPLPGLVDLTFAGSPTSADGPPTLLIHGTADTTADYAGSQTTLRLDPPAAGLCRPNRCRPQRGRGKPGRATDCGPTRCANCHSRFLEL